MCQPHLKTDFFFFLLHRGNSLLLTLTILDVPIFYHTSLSAQVHVIGLLSLLFGLFMILLRAAVAQWVEQVD